MLRTHRDDMSDPDGTMSVFEKRGGGELNPESLSATFRRLVDHARVSSITISGLRHTHAAIALTGGLNPLVVSERLGHKDTSITARIYLHGSEESDRAAAGGSNRL